MTRAMHAARGVSRAKGSTQHTTHPVPRTDLYGRWLWRGGSTRSHPELGSENPLRGWYCRGHPVGEYGAAGLSSKDPRLDHFDRGVGLFVSQAFTERFTQRTQRNRESAVDVLSVPLRLCVKPCCYQSRAVVVELSAGRSIP